MVSAPVSPGSHGEDSPETHVERNPHHGGGGTLLRGGEEGRCGWGDGGGEGKSEQIPELWSEPKVKRSWFSGYRQNAGFTFTTGEVRCQSLTDTDSVRQPRGSWPSGDTPRTEELNP